jgi:thiol-disulfide isomerase/thioredoxin
MGSLTSLSIVVLIALACGSSSEVAAPAASPPENAPQDEIVATVQSTSVPPTVAPTSTIAPAPTSTGYPEGGPQQVPKSEIVAVTNWINSEPTIIEAELERGNIVLVDFWTYTCINCLRTMPHLKAWYEKYADHGLTIIGVHTPEFEFEKDTDNVLEAVERIGVRWPVAQDNNERTWRRFGNHYWPAKYLFSPDHEIVYTHIGEGDYAETELAIREQLIAVGHDIGDIPFEPLPADTRL